MSKPKPGAARTLHWRACRHPRLACCLGPLVLIALGFSGAWMGNLAVLEPCRHLYRRGAGGVVLRLAAHLPAGSGLQNRVRSARFPVRATYKLIFWIVAALVLVALSSLRHAIFLLIGVHHEETVCLPRLAAVVAPSGPPPERHAVRTGHDLLRLPDHCKKAICKVEGVSKSNMTFETRQAVVTFDDASQRAELTKATADAGYPSSVSGRVTENGTQHNGHHLWRHKRSRICS